MADSRALLRPAQLLLLVKELRKAEGSAEPVDSESPLEAVEVFEREHGSGQILGG